jgi:Transposase IS66 family
VRAGPGPKSRKRYLQVACTNLLTYYFLGDRDLASFKDFVYSDLHGTVIVHDRYQNYDSFDGISHQLCCQHYPDTAVMPIGSGPVLAGGGDRGRDIGIIEQAAA